MNWVGGARNRLKTKDEKRRQKEFFEKMKYGSKVRRLSRSTSPRKANPPASLDLISLQAADFSAKKFDAEKGSKSKVKKVEMDRSKGLFPFHHHQDDLELSMSPGTPSKLQLQEPDERHPSYSMNYGETTRTADYIFPSSAQKLEHAMQWIQTDKEDSESLELRDQHDQIFQSSQFHSTPITQTLPMAPQQPLKHQGKHFEDLFFISFVPRGNQTLDPKDEPSLAPSVISEDDKLSDDFDYSPLSSIPSESSATSSLATISPGPQPYLQATVYSTVSSASQQEKETSQRKFVGSPADLTQNASPLRETNLRCPNSDTLCEDLGSNSSPTTSGASCRESPHPSKPQEEFESTVEKIDLLCEEQDSFLSPLGKNAGVATSGVKKSTRPCRQSNLPDTHSPENSTAVCNVSIGTPSAKELNLVEEENTFGASCPTPGKANSLKWKAFISGHNLTEKPVKQKVRNAKLTPTKAMSKVCEQVLKEVLQLDNELCKNSPLLQCSVSKTESLPSMMDFINFPMKEKKDGMEEFSVLVTEDLTRNQETNKQPAKLTPDQQVPDPGQEHTNTESEHVHFMPDKHSLLRTNHPKEIQRDKKRDGQRPDIQLQDEIKMSENTNGAEEENIHGKDLNDSSSSQRPNIQLQDAITIEESNGTDSEEPNDHARDFNVSGCGKKPPLEIPVNLHDAEREDEMTADSIGCENLHPEKSSQPTSSIPEVISQSPPHDPALLVPTILHVCEDKATQCNLCTTPSENKETQFTVNEFTCTDTGRNTASKTVPENMYHPKPALDKRPEFDAYDGCMLS